MLSALLYQLSHYIACVFLIINFLSKTDNQKVLSKWDMNNIDWTLYFIVSYQSAGLSKALK